MTESYCRLRLRLRCGPCLSSLWGPSQSQELLGLQMYRGSLLRRPASSGETFSAVTTLGFSRRLNNRIKKILHSRLQARTDRCTHFRSFSQPPIGRSDPTLLSGADLPRPNHSSPAGGIKGAKRICPSKGARSAGLAATARFLKCLSTSLRLCS